MVTILLSHADAADNISLIPFDPDMNYYRSEMVTVTYSANPDAKQYIWSIQNNGQWEVRNMFIIIGTDTLADLEESVPGARPPYGTRFFRFCTHFHRKAPMSEVHALPYGKSWTRHCDTNTLTRE